MSTVAEASRAVPRRKARAATGAFGGGVLWIVVVGLLLAGVVAINVLVLRLNVELDELRRTRAELKADIATSRAQLSITRLERACAIDEAHELVVVPIGAVVFERRLDDAANARIESEAATKLVLVPADPNDTTYVPLERR